MLIGFWVWIFARWLGLSLTPPPLDVAFTASAQFNPALLDRAWLSIGLHTSPTISVIDSRSKWYRSFPRTFGALYIPFLNRMILIFPNMIEWAIRIHGLDQKKCHAFIAGIIAHESQHGLQTQRYGPQTILLSYWPIFGVGQLITAWVTFTGAIVAHNLGMPAWIGAVVALVGIGDAVHGLATVVFLLKFYHNTWVERDAVRAQRRAESSEMWLKTLELQLEPDEQQPQLSSRS